MTRVPFTYFKLPDSSSAVPRASGLVFNFCGPGHLFGGTVSVGSRFCPFAHTDSFSAVPRASVLVFMFCSPGLSFDGIGASGLVFMFCAPEFVSGGTEGVGSHFHILRARTYFRRYRGCLIPFSCFAVPNMFSALSRASGPVFIFCAPEHIFGGTEGVGSRFHVLCAWSRVRRYRGRRIPFSCFALPDSFSAKPRSSGPVFLFCALGLVFDGTEGVGPRFHILLSQTHFRLYRGHRVPFSCCARPDSFSMVTRARIPFSYFAQPFSFSTVLRSSGPILDGTEVASGLIFGGTEGVGSRFHILRSQTHFQRYRGCRILFSCFARPNSNSVVLRASGPVFIFCASGLVFGGTESVGSRFHALRVWTLFQRYRRFRSRFHILHARTFV
jgi:hypothetical protein